MSLLICVAVCLLYVWSLIAGCEIVTVERHGQLWRVHLAGGELRMDDLPQRRSDYAVAELQTRMLQAQAWNTSRASPTAPSWGVWRTSPKYIEWEKWARKYAEANRRYERAKLVCRTIKRPPDVAYRIPLALPAAASAAILAACLFAARRADESARKRWDDRIKRALRWLWNRLAALSLLLCVAVFIVWVRSHRTESTCYRATRGDEIFRNDWYSVAGGRFHWTRREGRDRGNYNFPYARNEWDERPTEQPERNWSYGEFVDDDEAVGTTVLGFRYQRLVEEDTPSNSRWRRGIWVPCSFVAAAAALPPAFWAWRFHRSRRLRRPGLCLKCGYDLTGNLSGVCPECGTPSTKPALGAYGASSDVPA